MIGPSLFRRVRLTCLPLLSGFLFSTSPVFAADLFWDGLLVFDTSPDGVFSNAENWHDDMGMPVGNSPTTGDNANFDLNDTYTVTFTQDEASDLLNVTAGDVTLELASGATTDATYMINDDAIINGATILKLEDGVSTTFDVNLDIADQLKVTGGSDFDIYEGSQVTAANLRLGADSSGNGTITVNGLDSSLYLDGAPSNVIGGSNRTGTLNVQNNATATFDSNLFLAQSSAVNSSGFLNITTGGDVTVGGTMGVGTGSASGQTASLVVSGISGNGSTFLQTGATELIIGGSVGGNSALIVVNNNGDFSSGTGDISLNDTGSISVNRGTFNANGTLVMTTGGTMTLKDGGALNANAGLDNSSAGTLNFFDGTLTVSGGVFTPNAGGISDDYTIDGRSQAELPHLVLDAGSTTNIGRDLIVGGANQGKLTILAGTVSNTLGFIGDDPNSTGTVTVDGVGSTWMNSDILDIGRGGDGTLNIQNGGTVSDRVGTIARRSSSTSTVSVDGEGSTWMNSEGLDVGRSGNGTLTIQNGGVVSNTEGTIAINGSSTSTASVNGAGSIWVNSDSLYVGGGNLLAGGTGNLTVTDQGLVDVTGTLKIWSTGTVTLDGGSIVSDAFDNSDGGTFNFLAGTLTLSLGIEVGSGTAFPQNLTLATHQTLHTPGSTNVAINRTLSLNGGTLKTNNLIVDGAFQFNRGTLELTVGTITGLSTLTIPTNGTLKATGVYDLPVSAALGSVITATDNLTLGNALDASGFYSNGNVNINDNVVILDDLNDVVFDSGASISLGNAGTGTLTASNGLSLDLGGNITGFGTIDTPDNAATPLINNGNITGNSIVEPITLSGYVKGVGTCDNCNITGTDAPGFSPAAVNRGSVAYNGTLEIELGGSSPGSGFDQLNHILGSGIADLGGTLDITLINGFTPTAGDTFEIITAESVIDTFDTLNLPTLPGDLLWFVNYSATSVQLVSTLGADFDEDGDVDDLDLAAWEGGFGNTPATHMTGDANENALASGFDFLIWQQQFGIGGAAVTAAATTIPEPTSLLLAVLGLVTLSPLQKRP